MNLNLPYVKTPCKDCPFRKDCLKGWLGKERMHQILSQSSFACHKDKTLQCAGHMIIKNLSNKFVNLAYRLNIPLKLLGIKSIFENYDDCINHHS